MGVRYKFVVSLATIIFGFFVLSSHAWVFVQTGSLTLGVVPGAVMALLGALTLARPIFELGDGHLKAVNLLGFKPRAFPMEDLEVERDGAHDRKTVYLRRRNGSRRRLFGTDSWVFDQKSCRSVIAGIESGQVF
ncbi:MAG: hypothetical protein AAFQ67_09660 [Pseudomonadota bacterium]